MSYKLDNAFPPRKYFFPRPNGVVRGEDQLEINKPVICSYCRKNYTSYKHGRYYKTCDTCLVKKKQYEDSKAKRQDEEAKRELEMNRKNDEDKPHYVICNKCYKNPATVATKRKYKTCLECRNKLKRNFDQPYEEEEF